jgi:hypothetical protein
MSSILRNREAETEAPVDPPARPLFPAASIKPGGPACEAAVAASQKRTLVSQIRKLPLPDCTMASTCTCRFVKHSDRRDGDERRLFGWDGTTDWYGANNRRRSRRRRSDDL